MVKKCQTCGKLFDDDGYSSARFCSNECADEAVSKLITEHPSWFNGDGKDKNGVIHCGAILDILYSVKASRQHNQNIDSKSPEEPSIRQMPNNSCKDLTGRRFGMLKVIERGENDKNRHARWLCQCDCGKTVLIASSALLNGHQESCGCSRKKTTTHGESKSRLYKIYQGMKQRCYNPKQIRYKDYGGRGIHICQEWLVNYSAFAEWAKKNGYADNLSIDRINVDGNYEPANCRWIPMSEQSANRRMCNKK